MAISNSGRLRVFTALAAAVVAVSASMAVAQDVDKGERIFKKCKACHQVGEKAKRRTGPVLNGIVGAAAGQVEGFKYSDAMAESGLTWDNETLARFLAKPKEALPGTKMSFAGLRKEEEIANVIAYLATFSADGSPSE